ncbi:ubiquinone/menaquinone biosynthesis methyltransferase [Brevundimonas sp. FT23028]|uniref:ubiquinone/menaquinone biosynthesis methyltransferase n=1 Tax=Brevundimonas sp. FT23028 TaxID=3393748 RepID=UPI003B58726B
MADNSADFRPTEDDVFGRIAGRYDRLCDVFSLGIHRFWKSRMAARIAAEPPGVLLDLASGTGDIPCRLWRRLGARPGDWRLRVTDISPQMLAIARDKLAREGVVADVGLLDAGRIDLPDASVDVVSMAFGLKITDRSRVLPEVLRVLKPGGVFLCLEASRVVVPGLHPLYLAYMDLCMPWIGRLATGGDASAYGYLLRGIHDFPDQRALAAELVRAGFDSVRFENLSLGIVALHRAVKPAEA